MVTSRPHGDQLQLKAYAGTDPATGKRCWEYEYVPLDIKPRALTQAKAKLAAKAHALAEERRRVRKEGLTPREQVEQAKPGEVTFGDAVRAWLDEHLGELEESGRDTPVTLLDAYVLPHLKDVELWRIHATLTPAEAERFPILVSLQALWRLLEASGAKRGGGLAPATMQRVAGVVKQVLGYAYARGWAEGNPARETRPAPYRRRRRALPDATNMGAFLGYLGEQHPAVHLFALLVMNGPRPNEAAALRITSFDLGAGRMRVGDEGVVLVKTDGLERKQLVGGSDTEKRRIRTVGIDAGLVDVVRRRLQWMGEYADHCRVAVQSDAFLFSPEPDGSDFYEPRWASQAFRRWVQRASRDGAADLPDTMVLYDCRHFGITTLLGAGVEVADVAERFGTSARMIYNTYAHAVPGRSDDKAAAALGELLRGGLG